MLKQKFLVQFGSSSLLSIFALLAGIVVARVAGPEVVGILSYGTAYVSVFGFVNGLFSTGHIKLISEGQDIGKCNTTYTYLQGGSIIIYFLIVSFWFLSQKYLTNYPFESITQQIVIVILLFANIASKLLDFNNVTFTSTLEQAKANYPIFIKSILWHLGRIIIVVLGFRAIGLASLNLTITILVLPVAWKLYKRIPRGKYDIVLARKYWSFVPPIAIIVIVTNLLNYSDKLLLSHFTNVTELGFYSAAYAIGGLFLVVARSTGQVFFPLFSKMITENDWLGVNRRIGSYQDFMSIFIFPCICVLILIGEPFLLALLGERYEPSVMPFKILLIATYVSIIGMPYGNIITGMGRFYLSAIINIFQLLVFIISISIFVSPSILNLGAKGLALNLLAVNITGSMIFLFIATRIGEVTVRFAPLIRYSIFTVVLLSGLFLEYKLGIGDSFSVLIVVPIFLIVAYLFLYLFRLISRDHIVLLIDILNIKTLARYIKDEIWHKK